ncbi:hypothetical protein NFI96_020002, partial [Prochilodus magdalenae]
MNYHHPFKENQSGLKDQSSNVLFCGRTCPPTQVECKKAQPKEVMFPPGTRGRARGLPYTMDAFMLGMGML